MIFFYFAFLNIIFFVLFVILQHSLEAYRWGAYIQSHDQLRQCNYLGYNFELFNEEPRLDYIDQLYCQRYFVEYWYHPYIPDEDFSAEYLLTFENKADKYIFDSRILEVDLRYKGPTKLYELFYKQNTAAMVLGHRDHGLIDKNINEKIFFKEEMRVPIPFFFISNDPLTSDQLIFNFFDDYLPEWYDISPKNKSVVFFKQ